MADRPDEGPWNITAREINEVNAHGPLGAVQVPFHRRAVVVDAAHR